MEPSVSSLAYKGTIPEAIAEAKRQKKLFVVHILGNNAESTHLEESTWVDPNVAESVSKYCILLQIPEGSTDAANFSAIYPHKSTPSIAVIGYNGVQLWQNEGFVSADILVSSLEKAWLSLHIQETTATFLTAALSSRKPEPHDTTASLEQGGSSRPDVPSLSTDNHGPPAHEDKISKLANKTPPGEVESSSSLCETTKESPSAVNDPKDSGVGHISSRAGDECPVPGKNLNAVDHHSLPTTGASQAIGSEEPESRQYKKTGAAGDNKIDSGGRAEKATVSVSIQVKKPDAVEEDKSDALDSCSSQSTDVYLNLRLLDGTNLQRKFLLTNTLRMVKDYVDENQASAFGSYDLAIPYPRKAFNDQDLNKTLSELGLFGRQALIVVPLNRATGYHRGGSSSLGQTISTTGQGTLNRSNEGYLGLVKRILSYVNPFSYLGGGASSSNSAQESQSGIWQYRPNPGLQNNLRSTTGRSQTAKSSDQSTLGNNSKSRQPQSTRFGSNIHTLKHEEDDSRFSDRNAFWNGNSTQYGGGDNDAK
ncbi:plant UBX domain-containing protein 11 [Diospyros lotus]|uniref:plant UBX domain-containing protein 11 n=1 Tax=Diospyros lotus TaxID=55363 RepID=UPI00225A3362|nr:plant UBX domain-containing protein 11 [Diospyros lotus]XP_052207352.1 plant UBX domain-containing protein 11 [Diospyros lotus]XP_052207354.1 plant UBX domain-containing protein 11 [Diospyros lotus]